MADSHHHYFIYYSIDGKKTTVKTKTSHGHREISDDLIAKMVRQVKVSRSAKIRYISSKLVITFVDSLVNNAASYIVQKHFSKITMADLSQSLLLNLVAPFLLSSALFPAMCSRGFGRIVNISSIAAKYGGSPFSMHYGCFKRGLEGITLTLAREGAAQGVLVNTIRPGVIDTSFHQKYPKDMQTRLELIPIRRMGTTKDVVEHLLVRGKTGVKTQK